MRASLLDSQRRALERVASHAPINDVLVTLVELIEEQAEGMRCTILLANAEGTRLRFVAGPGFPDELRESLRPHQVIGPASELPCARAAYYKRPVHVRDIAAESWPLKLREVLLRNGVRAIWSTPLLADDGRLLGTFAMYYGEPRLPDGEHTRLIDMAVQMARIAIEAATDADLLQASFEASPHAIAIVDMEGRIVRANEAFAGQLGYAAKDLATMPIAQLAGDDHDPRTVHKLLADGGEVSRAVHYRKRDGTQVWARERASLRRGRDGKAHYVFFLVDETGAKDPLAALSGRERAVLGMVVAGRTSKDIAAELGISNASVDTYRSRLMAKLGIDDLPGLVRFAIRHGIARA